MKFVFNALSGGFDLVGQGISTLNVKGTVVGVASLPGGASVGDVYLVTTDAHFYVWDGTQWDDLGTLQGADGADGKTILNGSGAPSAGLGEDGDFYLNTTTTAIYGPKTAGVWGSPTSLIGPKGDKGDQGDPGDPGVGVPAGGTTGQFLRKASDTNYDASWSSLPATDLSYTVSSRLLASSTGADVTLPLFTSTQDGLTPQSGGGTTNFLRADGTWAVPPGGSGGTVVHPGYTAGNLIAPPTYRDGSVSSTPVVGLPTLASIYIPVATTFSQIVARTWSNYAGTSTIQLGIYSHNAATASPSALIYGSGDFTFTGSTNTNYGPAGFSVTLQPGFYWLAFLAISNATTPNFWGPASSAPGLGYPWHVEYTATGQATTVGRTINSGLTTLPANLTGNFRTDSFTRPIPMLVV